MDNYTIYHLHSMLSNLTAGTGADSITRFDDYLDLAQEYGMSAIAFSEHGSVMNWVKKKQETEKRGLKYIHANEIYLTKKVNYAYPKIDEEFSSVSEIENYINRFHSEIKFDREKVKLVRERDNYHFMTIAKNEAGVKELNKLTSGSFDKTDGHNYYNPRMLFDELKNTSDNILMTSACLASPIWRLYNNAYEKINGILHIKDQRLHEEYEDLMQFFVNNKHRMFFEVQYHTHPEQIKFNKMLYQLSKETGIPLIAGTDTHCLNKQHAKGRQILLDSKGASYGDEDKFDLTMKSYKELVDMFEIQGALSRDVYLEAIHNTNVMAEMVEEFDLDYSAKYPELYDNPESRFKERINEGFINRELVKLPKEERKVYLDRVREEYDTYEKLDAINYMLLQDNIIQWCHKEGIYQGYGRGSVNGSLIAYLLGVTEMDSIKHNLNFFRFLNPERISLADIDIDFPPSRRQEVIDYVASLAEQYKGKIYFAEIITFNTIAEKGTIRDVGRALKMPNDIIDEIAKSVDNGGIDRYRNKYHELFEYVDLIKGTIKSMGSHPSGFIVSPTPLEENISTIYTEKSKYPVTSINMKELDGLNYVKLDILGLDNIELINDACEMAGIERLTPDNVKADDVEVWKSLTDSTVGVFQFESPSAFDYVKKLFSNSSLNRIKSNVGDIDYISLLSMANGAIRPAGDSYRSQLANGYVNDNGHEALNEFLKSNLGYLIFQEDIMRFLTDFCNHTGSESDSVRRGLAKKEGTEQFLPKIREGFLQLMKDKYNESEEYSERILQQFLEVIKSASDYGFSLNHSQPYSYIGYVGAYLRYYYPKEFIATALNVFEDDKDKSASVINYAKNKGIHIEPIKFGKSKTKYVYDKSDGKIYKGLKSISYMNDKVADELYDLSINNCYLNFIALLEDITTNTSVNTNQTKILIRLGFFSEFGNTKHLEMLLVKFHERFKKTHKLKTKLQRLTEIAEYDKALINVEDYSISEKILYELDILGYAQTIDNTFHKSNVIITDINARYSPTLKLYVVSSGLEVELKINKGLFYDGSGDTLLKVGDLIKVIKVEAKPKMQKIDGSWVASNIMQNWLSSWEIIQKV
ncbi:MULTISPECIES: PHP domain-containing protein [Lysinibacillus]|uniref:PHP domain-containing protein n=1 Tax=Lysinibacillus TaxID=400634 RepID=UPI00214CEBCD|nr:MULTISPECIES: PHP domain-containing protein [Lysinibacillus]UUV25975.1 PHP domain-containing protein [Lysinibacillus sp. FN11]UYB48848.1 PHP domain-containing protein [Lysinibacillus capsici]